MVLTLYQLEGCPYCEKVVQRLDELEIDYETTWVPSLHSERELVKQISGQRQVPVLVDEDHGVTMPESDRILEYLDKNYA